MADSVSQEEWTAVQMMPAIFSNRFYLSVTGAGVCRLSFSEQVANGVPIPRTAVILSNQDGIALANLLLELLQPKKAEPVPENQASKPGP